MKLIKYIIVILLLMCSHILLLATNQEDLQSLIHQFKSSQLDSVKFQKLQEIDIIIDGLVKKEALEAWTVLIEYCEENDLYKELGFCYYNLAYKLNLEGDYMDSYGYYEKSLLNYEKVDYFFGIARVHNGLGILFKNLNKYELSIENYLKSAKLFNRLDSTKREAWVYLNMGGMYEKQDSLDHAIRFLHKSKRILEELNAPNKLNCYINLGVVFSKKKISDSAYYYFDKSYLLALKNGKFKDRFYASYHLGEHLFIENEINRAEPYLYEAQKIAENSVYSKSIAIYDRAQFFDLLSDFYATKGDSSKAYRHLQQSIIYNSENKIDQSNNEISRLEFEVLEKELQAKRKIRDIIIGVTLLILLFSLISILSLFKSYKHKQKANQLLTEMDELKTRLYSNITHELRTPLTLILGPLEQMLSSRAHKKLSRKELKMMRKNADTLLNLINQMLDLSKIEAKGIKLELVEEDINKFLRTRFSAFASLTEQRSISYQCSLLKEKNIRIFDAGKIEKIVNNLVSNAIKFTPANGKISCYVNFPKQDVLQIVVEDSGKGIPKNEVDHIFNRFHQVKSGKTINTIGTGIGLSLTKELVELMHGKIEVESELGQGCKFTVTLPLGTDHLDTDEFHLIKNHNSNASITPGYATSEECLNTDESNVDNKLPDVLIAEDHLDIREYIADNLKDCFNAKQAENGKIAFEHAIENIPDLVITDVVMPEMNGIEFCKNLKTDERTSHIPVIMLTGKSSVEDRLKGLETGADAYLTKPFNIKELQLRVQKLIEQRQKLRKRFTNNLNIEPKDIAVTSVDEKFISRAMEIIERNISNSEFEVRQFQEEMYMSRMQLFRKTKALTNQTPSEFIRTIRLKRAASLMKKNFGNIAQITFEVGFNNPSYFAKCFKELYGVLPSDYMKNKL